MNDSKDKFEDEIELMDYLRVIWKWKYLIVGGVLFCTFAAGVIHFHKPKVYSIKMVLQPGIRRVSEDGKNIYFDKPHNIKAMIDAGAFNNKILNDIKNPNDKDFPKFLKFKVAVPTQSDSIVVSYETSDIKLGSQIVESLRSLLLEKYNEMVNNYRKQYEKKIIMKKAEVENYDVKIKSYEQHIKNLNKRIDELESEIKIVNNNISSLTKERNQFLSNNVQSNNILSSILYTNTIQQNISTANTYKDMIINYRTEKENDKVSLELARRGLKKLLEVINDLEFKKNIVKNIQTLQAPTSSTYPIGPNKKRNVMLAATASFFLMLFLAFFLEYLLKCRK
jgi:uncharacterized protein involved in exopolysaccharide biosynthesis